MLFLSLSVSSGYNLLVLSIERYFAITQPFSYDEEKIRSRLWYVFPAVWISGFIFVFPDPFLFEVDDDVCFYKISSWSVRDAILVFSYYCCTNFLLPGTTMVILYVRMGIYIWKSRQQQKELTQRNTKQHTLVDAQRNIFYTCVVLLCLYFLCWLVLELNSILHISHAIYFSLPMFYISSNLILLNSAINPFIYTIRYTEFQKHLKMLFIKLYPCPQLIEHNMNQEA